jgi:Zn-finger nucleic acid-binding protein
VDLEGRQIEGGGSENMAVPRCPVCESERVIHVVGRMRRAFCARCGTKWIQEGAEQRQIEPFLVDPYHPTLRSRPKSR